MTRSIKNMQKDNIKQEIMKKRTLLWWEILCSKGLVENETTKLLLDLIDHYHAERICCDCKVA